MIVDADDNSEYIDCTMTAADLGTESDSLVKAVERCHVGTSSSSNVIDAATEADNQSDKTGGPKSTGGFDIRKFTSAISSAKSNSEIEKIFRECSAWKPSKMACASEPGKTSESNEVNIIGSCDPTESRQSVPEAGRSTPLDSSGPLIGNATLTASTKSYSWSSSLPNGSRLERLASNAVYEQPESTSEPPLEEVDSVDKDNTEVTATMTAADVKQNSTQSPLENVEHVDASSQRSRSKRGSALPEHRVDTASSVTSQGNTQTLCDRNRTTIDDDRAGCVTQQEAASTRHSSSKSLRVGDFLPSRDDALETVFGSPRVSLIARHSRPRHFVEFSLDQSQYDRSVTATMFSHSAAISRLMSTPATSSSSDFGANILSNQSGNRPAADDQIGSRASSQHSVSNRGRSVANAMTSMSSIVDNTLLLSTGPLADTMASSLSQLPVSYQNIIDTSNAVMSSHVDLVVDNNDILSFAGRFSGSALPSTQAGQTSNMSPLRISRKLPFGRSLRLFYYCIYFITAI